MSSRKAKAAAVPASGAGAGTGAWSADHAAVRSALSPVADDAFTQPEAPSSQQQPQQSPLPNLSQQSRVLAASPTGSATGATSKHTASQQSAAATPSSSNNRGGSSTAPSSGSSASNASGQEHLWSALKLDPLLIAHASGLHRVRADVATLKDHFNAFATHLLLMSKSGAVLTTHLSSLYKTSTAPPAIALMQSSHAAMHASSLSWFSSRFHNELLTQIDDWLEDCEDVLTQLGLVQKTRHELDGLQDEVEKVFSRKLEAPHWDASAESSLKRRLENAKEKLASACSLYDGQRRGVEKSMKFLLDQRALLFHQVITCFAESEYRFFRDFAAHAAGFVNSYPFSAMPPTCQFSEEPFARSHLQQDEWQHSASALLLTLPSFAWTDPSHADESAEGPSVRAIRRSMAQHLQKKQQQPAGQEAASSRRGSLDATNGSSNNNAVAGGWEAQAEAWEAQQSKDAASGSKATPEAAQQNIERELSSPLHTFDRSSIPPPVTAAPKPVSKVAALVSPASSATSADSEEDEDAVEELTMAELKQPAGSDGAEDEEAEEGEDEEEEEDEEAAAAAEAARQEKKRQKKERREAKRARKEAKKLRRMQEAQEEATDSDADQEVDEEPVSQPAPASAAAAAAAAAASVSPVALRTSIDPLSPTSSEYGVHIEAVSKGKKKAASAAASAVAVSVSSAPPLSVPGLGRSTSSASAASEASEAGSPDVFESPLPLTELTPQPLSLAQMPPSTAVDACTPRTCVDLQAAVQAQAGAAAALNLPAKMLSVPAPSVALHPALWEPVSLPRIKGSIWGRILVEHLEFDEETDELREKYSILPQHVPVFEQAFKADHPLNVYVASTQMERERQRQQEAMQSAQAAQAKAVLMAQQQTASTPSRRVAATQPTSDRFAHMRQLDGAAFVSSSPGGGGGSDTSFPAPPFPSFSSKQWYVAHQILTRVLFPFSASEVVEALYKMDDKILTPERVAGLMRIMPSQEQRGSILRAAAERQARLPVGTPLTPIEQLLVFLSLNAAPSLSSRLHALSFQVEFGPLCYNLERTLDVVESCVAELRKSSTLRILFAVVLHFGNRLNHSHSILPAYGFQLDFLGGLRRIRMASRGGGATNSSSLLDFLVWYLSSNYPALSFQSFSASSFPHLSRALQIDEYLLSMEMRHVHEGYAALKGMSDEDEFEKQNRSVSSSGGVKSASSPTGAGGASLPFPVSSFPPRVPRFLSYVQSRLTVLRHKHAKVRADLAELMRYLCVEPIAVRDPNLDAALAGMPPPLAEMALPPLGEVPASASGSGSTAPDGTPLHLRLPWQKSLRTLHRFLQEFSLALQDHLVAAKVARAAKIG